jgi:hypothetical protein
LAGSPSSLPAHTEDNGLMSLSSWPRRSTYRVLDASISLGVANGPGYLLGRPQAGRQRH